MSFNYFFSLAKKSVAAWVDDYAPSMGAAISYYTVFSIAPLLIIVIAVAGLVWGREAVQGQIVDQLSGLIGTEGAIGVQALIENANQPAKGAIATLISIGVLVLGATTVFAELQSAMDRIWDVPAQKKTSGIWTTLRTRLLSLGFILGLGFLLAVSLVFSAGMSAFSGYTTGLFPGWETVLQIINSLISLGLATTLFAMIFKLMPQAKVQWRDVWIGAAVTAVLFEVGKTLIGLYIGKSSVTSTFAAAGSLVVLLIWVYYSAQIFLLGAEFTWVYANEHGTRSKKGQPVIATAAEREALAQQDGAAVPAEAAVGTPSRSGSSRQELSLQQPATGTRPKVNSSGKSGVMSEAPTLNQRALVYVATHGLVMLGNMLVRRRQIKKLSRLKRLKRPKELKRRL